MRCGRHAEGRVRAANGTVTRVVHMASSTLQHCSPLNVLFQIHVINECRIKQEHKKKEKALTTKNQRLGGHDEVP
jgi:hypothetical protein